MPEISVILPVYNADRYLYDSVQSILAQSYSDFELLVIDDGSSSSPAEILESFHDPRIRLIRMPTNKGISAALNTGIREAVGAFIARMDADDVAHPDRLRQQYEYLRAHPDTSMVASWVRLMDEKGNELKKEWFHPAYYYYNLCFICWIYHPTIMLTRKILEEVGGYTETYSEDFELFWQIMRRTKIAVLKDYLLDYRISPESLHNVLKKNEYESQQQAQVKRNMAFYLGRPTVLNDDQVLALRHHFEPLLVLNSVKAISAMLKELDAVSEGMIQKENPNRIDTDLKRAWYYKKQFIISFYARRLPRIKGIAILLLTHQYRLLINLVFKKITRS